MDYELLIFEIHSLTKYSIVVKNNNYTGLLTLPYIHMSKKDTGIWI